MKKILLTFTFIVFCLLTCSHASAKVYKSGAFSYQYKIEKGGVWITKIEMISDKGLATLKIPSHIKGKKVTMIGSSKEDFKYGDSHDTNIFGVFDCDDYGYYKLIPTKVHKKVGKIKRIILPSTLEKISKKCFYNVKDGTTVNIPQNITYNIIDQLTRVKWKKITISPQNPKFKIKNGCLLSKSGKTVYGIVQKRKTIYIPGSVRTIDNGTLKDGTANGDYNGADTIVIPKSVNKVKPCVLETSKPVIIKIDNKNKRYAVKDGSVYSKKTGRLVAGYVKNGVLSIPNTVSRISYSTGYLGAQKINKIIVPSSVKKIGSFEIYSDKITLVFKGKTPPKLPDNTLGFNYETKITAYVPAKYKKKYKKWLQNTRNYEIRKIKIRTI